MDLHEIPPFFLCPISLQIMKDPVTLSTGMTYDRESIQKWLFSYNNNFCPVTKQHLGDLSLTPNSTLLRLIQSWCTNNPSKTISEAKPTLDASIIQKLFDEVRNPESQTESLKKIKSLISENDRNKTCLEEAGLVSIMVSLITDKYPQGIFNQSVEEAMNVLYLLQPSIETIKKLEDNNKNDDLISSLSFILQRGNYQNRIKAALLLKSIFMVVDENYLINLRSELFEGLVEILKDQNSNQVAIAALSILIEVCRCGKNRIKATEAGIVAVLVELLLESNDKRMCEVMLGVLEMICGKAEGRCAFLSHPAGLAAVGRKMFMVSEEANEKAVKVLLLVCKFSGNSSVVEEMIEVGCVEKLCMAIQNDCSRKTKEMAKEILWLHYSTWKGSSCFSSYLMPGR